MSMCACTMHGLGESFWSDLSTLSSIYGARFSRVRGYEDCLLNRTSLFGFFFFFKGPPPPQSLPSPPPRPSPNPGCENKPPADSETTHSVAVVSRRREPCHLVRCTVVLSARLRTSFDHLFNGTRPAKENSAGR